MRDTAASNWSWHESDLAAVQTHYVGQLDRLATNRRQVAEVKSLYGKSQVAGDQLPPGLPPAKIVEALEVHLIQPLRTTTDDKKNMLVVSASLHALIHADPNCRIDLSGRYMVLFGVRLELDVKPTH